MTSLRQRLSSDKQIRNLSVHAQRCYLLQVSLFVRHFNKSRELLGPEQIRAYQVYLTRRQPRIVLGHSGETLTPVRPRIRCGMFNFLALSSAEWTRSMRSSGRARQHP
jgi:hypothetical protein